MTSAKSKFLEEQLGYHLRRLSVKVMTDLSKSLACESLTPVEASILFALGARHGLTQSDLGRELGILRANMTPLIKTLAKRALVERENYRRPLTGTAIDLSRSTGLPSC